MYGSCHVCNASFFSLCEFLFFHFACIFLYDLINVSLIPCNQYVLTSFDYLPPVFVHVDLCLLDIHFTCDMEIADTFTNYLYHCNLVTLELEGSLMFWSDIRYSCIRSFTSRFYGQRKRFWKVVTWVVKSQKVNVPKHWVDEALQFQAHDCQTFLCFDFFIQSTWL